MDSARDRGGDAAPTGEGAAARHGLLFAAICLAGGLLPESWLAALSLRPEAVAAGEFWRLWSGHWVHFGLAHAAPNALAILVLALCLPQPRAGLWPAALLLPPLLGLGILLLSPGLQEYRGASGIASMLMFPALAAQARRAPRLVAAVAGFWLLKLVLEATGMGTPWQTLPPEVALSWPAHLTGVVLGAAVLGWGFFRHGNSGLLPRRGYNPPLP